MKRHPVHRFALVLVVVLGGALVVATSVPGAVGEVSNGKIAFTKVLDANQLWSMRADGTRKTRLVSGAGLAYQGVLSPDGKRLAFVSSQDGDTEIYVATATGRNPRQLTDNTAIDFCPSWSPDGRRLVFSSDRDGNLELYTMSAVDGSGVKRLTTRPGEDLYPAWSPKAKLIAFSSDRAGDDDIYVVRPDGKGLKRLTTSRDDEYQAAWFPDGRTIAYTVDPDDDDSDIWIMNANGSGKRPLVSTSSSEAWPSFAPDGKRLAFTSWDDIVVQTLEAKPKRKTVAREGYGPSWGRSGRIVYCRTEFENAEIAVADASGENEQMVTRSPAYDGDASWSPDGTTLVFTSDREKGDPDLYVMDASGGSLTKLLKLKGYQGYPAWSPDGRQVYFVGSSEDFGYRLFVYDVDSRGYRRVETFADEWDFDFDPTVAPDGRRVAFASYRGDSFDLYVVDTVTGTLRRLTSSDADEWAPAWSPDGESIAFASDASGDLDIWVYTMATGALRRLTSTSDRDDYPTWSPDGTMIAFHRTLADGTMHMFTMSADGTGVARVGHAGDPCGMVSWQPVPVPVEP